MTGQPTLPTDRAHDLPRFWDGKAVVWRGWQPLPDNVFICPRLKSSCCKTCGSLTKPVANWGRVAQIASVTHEMVAAADAKRDRLPAGQKHRISPRALIELTAFRCPDCRHDQISDRDGHLWDLDESDYGNEGSWER